MLRRFTILCCLILAACGSQTVSTQPPAATEAPKEEPDNPWKDPYETNKAELCPEDITPTGQPVFGDPLPETLDGQPVFVQRGFYANSQNEIFRIDVTGVTPTAVTDYTSALLVCLDYVTSSIPTPEAPEAPTSPTPSSFPTLEPFGINPEDLIIELYVQGFYGPDRKPDEVAAILKDFVNKSTDDWTKLFEGTDLKLPDSSQSFMLDLVLDPTVNSGATHQYVERNSTRVYVKASVALGSGSVKAGLCRGLSSTTPFTTMTVWYTSTQTASRSHSPTPAATSRYDLGVKGNPSGKYRISARYLWTGWSADYPAPAPTGSAKNCNP